MGKYVVSTTPSIVIYDHKVVYKIGHRLLSSSSGPHWAISMNVVSQSGALQLYFVGMKP